MGKINWDNCEGKNPENYARKLLKICNIKEPPIDDRIIIDYLDLTIIPVNQTVIDEWFESCSNSFPVPSFINNLQKTGAWLHKDTNGKSSIYIYKDLHFRRIRTSIFHEIGHVIIPWHGDFFYKCEEMDIVDPTSRIPLEKEAFKCASELMMPGEKFIDDAMSLKTSISSIITLGERYNTSLEATAIRYCTIMPRDCAMLMVEPRRAHQPENHVDEYCQTHSVLFTPSDYPLKLSEEAHQYPLSVSYCVSSSKYMGYAKKGTGINENNPIFETLITGKPFKGKIHASVWGSSKNISYDAECRKLSNTGKVLVLLWRPDNRLWFDF